MNSDIFGDLEKWAKVLDILDRLEKSRKLDEHQTGLARILKDGQHWRLLEKALECGKEITEPQNELVSEVFNVVTDRSIYLDARILAVNSLSSLVRRINRTNNHKITRTLIIRKMRNILDLPEPPIFREAIAKSLQAMIGKNEELDTELKAAVKKEANRSSVD